MMKVSTAGVRASMAAAKAVALVLLGLAGGLSGCVSLGGATPVPLAHVDMSRMYGGWYLIATRQNSFEKHMVGPYDVYARRPDGDIREDFYVRTRSFEAPLKHFVLHDWVRPGTNNSPLARPGDLADKSPVPGFIRRPAIPLCALR